MVQFRCGYQSITGNFRENNEDNGLVDPDGRYFIVADGMGGQSAGEKASELAVELIPPKLLEEIDFAAADVSEKSIVQAIDLAVEHANAEIIALGEIDPDFHNMGTTTVLLVSVGGAFYVAGIGDSRVYLLRDGSLEQLTTDHTLTQALLDAGTISEEEAANHRYRNVLYRYLGTKEGGTGTEAKRIVPQAGDRFVLCSDGVTDGIDGEAIQSVLDAQEDPQQAAEAMVVAAQEGGSRDNITCLVLNVDDGPSAE